MSIECQYVRNRKHCTCTYEPCSRKGRCCDCVEYHRQMNEVPGCFFPPQGGKSYDRSIRKFIESRQVKKYDE